MRRSDRTSGMRARPWPLALIALLALVAAVISPATLALLAPVLVLLALLLAGRAPGEELLLRWRRARPPRRRRAVALTPHGHRPVFARARSRISASALAMRPPPAASPLAALS